MDFLDKFEFRDIKADEGEEAARIENICFPPNEACPWDQMIERAKSVSDLFLVAYDKEGGQIAGFLNGIATNEEHLRDDFFKDASLHIADGKHIMLLGLDVLPEYQRHGLAGEIVRRYAEREKERGRLALVLTCLDEKVKMYEKMGFADMGISASTWGGETWHEMVYEIAHA